MDTGRWEVRWFVEIGIEVVRGFGFKVDKLAVFQNINLQVFAPSLMGLQI
jgi:hypothetical protein